MTENTTINTSYTIYGGELSLFTRKLEAAAIFYGLDFELLSLTDDNRDALSQRAGTHQIPLLHTPENWVIADTTPLLRLLDSRHPARAMFPEGAVGALVHILEEFFDEWVARVMVHYRWHYPRSAEFASTRMANGNAEAAARVRNWGPRACRATGTDSKVQQQAAEDEYLRLMQAAEDQLKQTAFLLGERPTALDCIVLGGLRAHTLADPDPAEAMQRFPVVTDWANKRADTWDGSGELASVNEPTAFAQRVLGEFSTSYGPYVLANANALSQGAKACQAQIYGENVSYLTRPYPEASRKMVQATIEQLAPPDRAAINKLLQDYKVADLFSG